MTNFEKILNHGGKPKPRNTGTMPWKNQAGIAVTVLTREEWGLDDADEPWVAVCEHDSGLGCSTKALAIRSARQSWEWCEDCRRVQEERP